MIDIQKLDTVLQDIMHRWDIPGLGVGIVQDGTVAYARGFGVQSLETRVPVTPNSIFCVASVAKCFVACAAMQLVEQGKLELDVPLVAYLPYFRLDDERCREITLRQILSHTSGMPDMDESKYDELVANPEYDEGAPERYVRALASSKMIAAPGERFSYSNIAYNVLGHLIAKTTGQTFETFMQEHILRPAGMPDSTFYFPDVPRQRLAVPHLRAPAMAVNPVYPYHRADAPASFLHSTVLEMCQWSLTCLDDAIHNTRRLLSSASFDLMWEPVAERGYPPFYEHSSLGWTIGHFDGFKTVSHGGMGFGWTDFLLLLPERNCAAVILSNEESWARSCTTQAVVDAMLERDPVAGKVSWMIPISRALAQGGIQAAYACSEEIKHNDAFYYDEDELISLVYQLIGAGNIDTAIEVLKLNIQTFPKHLESQDFLARLDRNYVSKG